MFSVEHAFSTGPAVMEGGGGGEQQALSRTQHLEPLSSKHAFLT